MRIPTPIQALSAAAALALLAGCSGGSSIAPKVITPQGHVHQLMGHIIAAVGPMGQLKVNMNTGQHFASFDTCPTTGAIEYISDFNNSVINIYKGTFAGQAPCGSLGSGSGISFAQGMFVKGSNHHLFVANSGGLDILEFARGGTTAVHTFADPSAPEPADVTVDSHGIVIASNIAGGPGPSISTWTKTGTFIGNFLMPNASLGLFVTVQAGGKLYYNDVDITSGAGVLYKGKCPAGACGPFTATGATSAFPGGLRSADFEDLVQDDQSGAGGGTLNTYEHFPSPSTTCSIGAGDAVSIDINKTQKDVFYGDATNNVGGEIKYHGCTLVGTVPGNSLGLPIGAAVDAPEVLK
jgi:hypothetical protein